MRGLFASGVTVVTTVHEERLRGITVSAFASISLEPPLVMISLAREAGTCEMIEESGVFAVNILSDDQEFLSERFAARAPIVNEKFEGVPYEHGGDRCADSTGVDRVVRLPRRNGA